MEIVRELRFDTESAEQVFAVLADPDFDAARHLATGASRVERLEERAAEERRWIRTRITRPRPARGVGRPTSEIIYQEMVVDHERMRVSWSADIPEHGDRFELNGTLTCQSIEPSGCIVRETTNVEVYLAQVGRSVERAIAQDLLAGVARDQGFIRQWMAERRLAGVAPARPTAPPGRPR